MPAFCVELLETNYLFHVTWNGIGYMQHTSETGPIPRFGRIRVTGEFEFIPAKVNEVTSEMSNFHFRNETINVNVNFYFHKGFQAELRDL